MLEQNSNGRNHSLTPTDIKQNHTKTHTSATVVIGLLTHTKPKDGADYARWRRLCELVIAFMSHLCPHPVLKVTNDLFGAHYGTLLLSQNFGHITVKLVAGFLHLHKPHISFFKGGLAEAHKSVNPSLLNDWVWIPKPLICLIWVSHEDLFGISQPIIKLIQIVESLERLANSVQVFYWMHPRQN